VVLRRKGCITWTTSAVVEPITYTSLTIKTGRFGYGIIGWDIPHFGIYVIYFQNYSRNFAKKIFSVKLVLKLRVIVYRTQYV
jgi:hypothetical protein